MIDTERIEDRLRKLGEYNFYLKSCQKYSYEQIKRDMAVRGSIERYFQLSIECLIDVGEILISNLKLKKPEDSRFIIN